jgi:hypothetical protein
MFEILPSCLWTGSIRLTSYICLYVTSSASDSPEASTRLNFVPTHWLQAHQINNSCSSVHVKSSTYCWLEIQDLSDSFISCPHHFIWHDTLLPFGHVLPKGSLICPALVHCLRASVLHCVISRKLLDHPLCISKWHHPLSHQCWQ